MLNRSRASMGNECPCIVQQWLAFLVCHLAVITLCVFCRLKEEVRQVNQMMEELRNRDNVIINRLQTSELLLERERDKLKAKVSLLQEEQHERGEDGQYEESKIQQQQPRLAELEAEVSSLKETIAELEDQRDSLATKLAVARDAQQRLNLVRKGTGKSTREARANP